MREMKRFWITLLKCLRVNHRFWGHSFSPAIWSSPCSEYNIWRGTDGQGDMRGWFNKSWVNKGTGKKKYYWKVNNSDEQFFTWSSLPSALQLGMFRTSQDKVFLYFPDRKYVGNMHSCQIVDEETLTKTEAKIDCKYHHLHSAHKVGK